MAANHLVYPTVCKEYLFVIIFLKMYQRLKIKLFKKFIMEDIFSKWSIYIKKIILTIKYSPQRNPVKHNSKNEWKRAKFKCVHDVIEAWPSNLIEKTRWMVYTFKLFPLCWIIKIQIDLAGWILEKKE